MSYLTTTRPYHYNDSSLLQNRRLQVSSDSASYPSPTPSHQPPSSFPPHPPPLNLPKVGQTRCYWALLSSDLHFIYLDPVLASHLQEQAELLVGKSLLSFVHPDEQASAKQDLGNVLESRTLHGSVTRVRFSRLSAVRRQLGYNGPSAVFADAEKIAVDANYMAVDIVINWAAEGLVLCFMHAVVDLTPHDNDEHNKTGWTNWCGTPLMSVDQIQLLYGRLLVCLPHPPTSLLRVFQILANDDGRRLLMSWPPDTNHPPSGRDFARLVENARIGTATPDESGAKTSCTRRYKAMQATPSAIGGDVESIFIPHGTVIFACHKVNSLPRSTASPTVTMQQLGYGGPNYNPHSPQSTSYYEQGSYALPPLNNTTPSYNTGYPPQPPGYAQQRWSQAADSQSSYNGWGTPSPAHSTSPLPPAVSNLRSGSYSAQQTQQWQPPSPSYLDAASGAPGFNRSISPNYAYSPTAGGSEGGSPSSDVVPPARRRVSPGSTREQYGSGGRSSSNRPMGVLKCSSCKATTSPEWRKGPSGKKELCNACGLRYARSRAKKEGSQTQRRKKDKGGITKRDSATPPTSASPSYSSIRRSYGDTSFSSTGSNSGSEVYPQTGHHMLNEITPSPSPPAPPNVNFVHYSPGDNRQSYPNTSGPFYNSSPLSNPSVLHPNDQQGNQLPPLDQISSYVDRGLHSAASPVSHSPLATAPPASYERDRDRDRPAPVSVGPRHPSSRRSILTQQ